MTNDGTGGEAMTDIVALLRATALDADNFPRMKSERYLPVGLALEAAHEIERLREALETCRELRRGDAVMLQMHMARVRR